MTNTREISLEFLYKIYYEGAFSNILLNSIGNEIDDKDKRLVRELVYGVLENDIFLEYCISDLAKIPIKNQRREILLILKMAIYQIRFLDKIPDRAAIYEAVEQARRYDNKYAPFVNGLLREYTRKMDFFDKKTESLSKKALSLKYSIPMWIINYWIKIYSIHQIKYILENLQVKSLFIRVNPLKTTKKDLKKSFDTNGIEYQDLDAPYGMIIKSKGLLTKSPEYKNGLFSIQDISSQRIPDIIESKGALKILDLCAAPGGKSLAIAEKFNDEVKIIASDISKEKLKVIDNGKNRLGIKNIKCIINDALIFNEKLGLYDVVLLDAPCSGLGTIGKKPEIKLRLKWKKIEEISEIQGKMLDISKNYVKKGGLLIYSTCTISKLENEDNINKFLINNKDFSLENFKGSDTGMTQFLPSKYGGQGFFIAKLRKK